MASKVPTTPAEWMERFAPSAERLTTLEKICDTAVSDQEAQAILRKFLRAHKS